MQSIIILSVLCLAAVNAYLPVGPPVPHWARIGEKIEKVVGGSAASSGTNPMQVSLRSGTNTNGHFCGGSIGGSRSVITAAHCCAGQSASGITVAYGGLNRQTLPYSTGVSQIIIHGSYSSSTINNDYCILITSSAIQTNGGSIQVATIPTSAPAAGANAVLTGWGRTTGTSPLPTALQVGNMQITSTATCQAGWQGVNTITANMICAGAQTVSGCNGDSGGPLTVNGQLVGIVSWGASGCPANTLTRNTVYANAVTGRTWITNTISSNGGA